MLLWWVCLQVMLTGNFLCSYIIQCIRKVTVHLGYGRVQCDGTRWRTIGGVRNVTVHLWKVLEVMYMSVYTGLNPFNFIRKHFLQICLCLNARRLSECTVFAGHTNIKYSCTMYQDFCVISSLFICLDRWNIVLQTYCSQFWNSFFPINFK